MVRHCLGLHVRFGIFLFSILLSSASFVFTSRISLFVVQIRDYHRRHPAARVVDATEENEELLKEEPHIEFSGEVLSVPIRIQEFINV